MRGSVYLRTVWWTVGVLAVVQLASWAPSRVFASKPPSWRAGAPVEPERSSASAAVEQSADLVILGNSRSRSLQVDLVRDAYERVMNRSPVITDLRLAGTEGINQYCLFEDYLAGAPAPSTVVTYVGLEDVLTTIPTLPEAFRLRHLGKLLRMGLDVDQALNLTVAQCNWLYANKSRVNSAVLEWLLARTRGGTRAVSTTPSTSAPAQPAPQSSVDWSARLQRHCYVAELGSVDPVKVRALRALIADASRTAAVVLVLPPYHDDMRRFLLRNRAYREFRRAMGELARLPGVTLVDERLFGGTDRSDFFDPTHLSEEAGTRFTQRLLDAVLLDTLVRGRDDAGIRLAGSVRR